MEYKLEEIAEYSNKKIEVDKINCNNYISTENMLPNKLGIVKAVSLPNQSKVCFYEKNNILISNIRPYFKKIWFANCDGGCSNDVLNIMVSDTKKVLPKFLYYLLFQDNFFDYVMTGNKGTKMPRGDKKHIMKYTVNIPSIEKQIKIIDILDSIDKKIEINNNINDNLQKLCNQYYLCLINDKREEVSLAELMDYQGGSQPPASEFQYISSSDNIRFVQIRDFDTDSHICYIPNSSKNKICQEDDILIARYGASLGRICYGLYGAYNVALAKVLPRESKYKEIIRIILESKEFFEYINSVGQRSAQAGFNAGDIQAFKVKIPKDENVIMNYNNFASECLNKRLLNNKENKELEQLRDILLPKLMSEEIDLDKIEL